MNHPGTSRPFPFVLFGLLCSAAYGLAGFYFQRAGYHHGQALFFSEKASLVFQSRESVFNIIGLTYPILPFFATLACFGFNSLLAPVLASSLATGFLGSLIVKHLLDKEVPSWLTLVLFTSFLLNPAILYAGVSGSSDALTLLILYLFFKSLFEYMASNTTYHISISGLFLALLVFCMFQLFWLTLFVLPLILLLALNSMRLRGGTGQQLLLVFNKGSLRRKLIGRTYAVFLLIFILPLSGYLLFGWLNSMHTSNASYFAQSAYANWNVLDMRFHNSALLYAIRNPYRPPLEDFFSLIIRPLYYVPLLLPALYLARRNPIQFLVLLFLFAFIQFLKIYYPDLLLSVDLYLLFYLVSLLVIQYSPPASRPEGRYLYPLIGLCALLLVYTGYQYLKDTPISQEREFGKLLGNPGQGGSSNFRDDQAMAGYILREVPRDSTILADDAVAYPIVALSGDSRRFVLPYQQEFAPVLENPKGQVHYLLLSQIGSQQARDDQVRLRFPELDTGSPEFQLVYANASWQLFRIRNTRL